MTALATGSRKLIALALTLTVLIIAWQAIVSLADLPRYILPGPLSVIQALERFAPLLITHGLYTALEILLGFVGGVLLGILTALLLAAFLPVRRILLPLLLASQTIPIFAIAPLLMLWLGYGLLSKVVMAMLIIYFPVASTCFDGLRHTPAAWLDMATTLGATRRQRLFRIQLPAALPSLCSGLRMAATAAPIGAVIGEWVGSSQGLGYLMLQANGRMQTDLMFAALFMLIIIAVGLYQLVDWLSRWLVPWQQRTTTL
ncbi:ABC transporter permease [Larsenimonas rhizosphaerae]|uniref:ABC transporter permease n=1 Tax=Larsenimonas rhizosphaerae TaxID=2944682 RepID=A0AA41ZG27_9GAMM|nr:ABC transporter permease [Larsenimonas rhizosphaerae]MCM2130810.1 ABC transporter permease [Larsenimonas rhizosphaerae]MCX2523514.1 ABC transporter permease [Larsenimonas rhizosphaerae]